MREFNSEGTSKEITDANEAVASVAFRMAEVIAIYPITPSSPMAEFCDEWAAKGKKNLWNMRPSITEMQSEAGVAGAVHGALQCGSMVTTFTASQGLLLMIPNMYKIAGELLPFCMHVTARALATHALSIFGDHSDVMACRGTGFALLASNSVQEAHDLAAIATAATYETYIPFLHFFDGFRTSHEVNTYTPIGDEVLLELLSPDNIEAFRARSLTPDAPNIRGTAQNADVFFQGRERANSFCEKAPAAVEKIMDQFSKLTGRSYAPFNYVGDTRAEIVFIAMGSACETIEMTIAELGERVPMGLVKVHLYRPFSSEHLMRALPHSVKKIIVLDRTKELGSPGEPLYLDVVSAIGEMRSGGTVEKTFDPQIFNGRYGLGSKEFSPAMVKGIVASARDGSLRRHFSVGISDDVSNLSVDYDPAFRLAENSEHFTALFFGLGADGTVGANKNTIKIIGSETDNFAQAYFVYDSKKSGAMTVSHLRFGPRPIRAPYLIDSARFIGCHQFAFLNRFDVLQSAADGGIFLLNSPYGAEEIQRHLPQKVQRVILEKKLEFYAIDAYAVAEKCGMEGRINTVMQTCFFAISGILPQKEAIDAIKKSVEKTYGKKGRDVVEKNFACIDASVANLIRIQLTAGKIDSAVDASSNGHDKAMPRFVRDVILPILHGDGDQLPVSAMPIDGTWPTATSQWEKRDVAQEIPQWDSSLCIQCNKCALVCPHAAIRSKFYDSSLLKDAPSDFRSADFRSRENPNCRFTVQVFPEDCTGCGVCVENCPAKNRENPDRRAIHMERHGDVCAREKENCHFFLNLPDPEESKISNDIKGSQFRRPLFEFSGACAGCGETPYVKLLTQLFGDHLYIANATGCSSIYGGNLPTTPYCKNNCGRGPTWANSLFEDNAEFGLGMLLSVEHQREMAREILLRRKDLIGENLVQSIVDADQSSQIGIDMQRERIGELRKKIIRSGEADLQLLHGMADKLIKKSVWVIGGDGWAYDIGYGGIDHVLGSGKNIKILVLDTEVYSNTGGQQSKSTPRGAVAKFAASGKALPKKDLGRMAMNYGYVYVAQIALGAKDSQALTAFMEAEAYDGPALIIAYCPCISHGFEMRHQLQHQQNAVASGYWSLYRFDPRRLLRGENPMQLDSKPSDGSLHGFMESENRFSILQRTSPELAEKLEKEAGEEMVRRREIYEKL
ncbi:MAG: pyruvate:ferredoxin (flavodoxin) oxidoreductase [Puniceicoccales bacterium]|jgi:pyruvate-ferredoxin/flavodoxin oxidoreductase|nr:pyruvate:ferredoxin (flavodoxin) oxidoreductase [Puniceicoccales bacterium]